MTQVRIAAQLNMLQSRVHSSLNLLSEAKTAGMHPFQLQRVAELCALRIFMAWEAFLEDTFLRYMCGATSIGGLKPSCCAIPRDLKHARDIVCGMSNRDFIDWASPDKVIQRSMLYFHDGEPFNSAVSPATVELRDFRTVRNRIAHDSDQARNDFAKLVRHHLGSVPRGMGPGRFLTTVNPNRTGQLTYLGHWSGLVGAVAVLVAA